MIRVCSVALSAPTAAMSTVVVLNACIAVGPRLQLTPLVFLQVYIVRCSRKSGVALNLFPSRRTCAAPPFSTCGPSGRSENRLFEVVVHEPRCGPAGSEKVQ